MSMRLQRPFKFEDGSV